jgi:alkylhydroperoxidase family enzyme
VGTNAGTGSRELTQLRDVVRDTAPARSELAPYLEKVHQHAYRVTDEDVAALKAAGVSEDEIFEQTVAAAIAEGLRRLDAAEGVL